MALAYPDTAHSDLWQVIARDHFITALNDREIKLKLRERDPVDLEAAYKATIRVETYLKAYEIDKDRASTNHRDNVAYRDASYRRDKRDDHKVRQVAQNDNQSTSAVAQMNTEVTRLATQLELLRREKEEVY